MSVKRRFTGTGLEHGLQAAPEPPIMRLQARGEKAMAETKPARAFVALGALVMAAP